MSKLFGGWGSKTKVDIDAPVTLGSIVFLAVLAPAIFILQPGYVQGLVAYVGFTEAQSGQIVSAEMFGLASMAIFLNFIIERFNWRLLTFLFITIFLLGNVMSLGEDSFETLAIIRYCAGLGSGGLMSITFTMMGLTTRTERNMALIIGAVLVYAALGLFAMPTLYHTLGMDGLFYFLVAFSVAGFFFVNKLPCYGQADAHKVDSLAAVSMPGRLALLAAMLAFSVAVGSVWVYIFLVGINADIAEQSVANTLTAAQLTGIMGALCVVVFEERLGRRLPLMVGTLGAAASIVIILGQPSLLHYVIGVCLFTLLWNMTLPYILATFAFFDSSGKLVVQGISMQTIGFAGGPTLAAAVLGRGGHDLVNQLAIALFISAALLFLSAFLMSRRDKRSGD